MADLFAIIGVVTVSLLGVTRWWEERQAPTHFHADGDETPTLTAS